jgi:hypothetical protein
LDFYNVKKKQSNVFGGLYHSTSGPFFSLNVFMPKGQTSHFGGVSVARNQEKTLENLLDCNIWFK